MNRLVITELPLRERGPFLFAGIFSDLVLLETELLKAGKESLVGNIYAARVKGVHQGTKSAFLSLDGVHKGFLPLTKLNGAVFTKKVSDWGVDGLKSWWTHPKSCVGGYDPWRGCYGSGIKADK